MRQANRTRAVSLTLLVMGFVLACTGSEDRAPIAEDRAITVPAFRGTTIELAAILQKAGVPVSIIQALDDPRFELNEQRIEVRRLLEKVEILSGVYRLESIDGRMVLYPKALPFDREIRNVDFVGRRRFTAAAEYVRLLKKAIPELPQIVGPVETRAGPEGRIPFYDDPVTLEPNARVIDHLVQLLGTDKNLYFLIKEAPGLKRPAGAMLIYFGSVERP